MKIVYNENELDRLENTLKSFESDKVKITIMRNYNGHLSVNIHYFERFYKVKYFMLKCIIIKEPTNKQLLYEFDYDDYIEYINEIKKFMFSKSF